MGGASPEASGSPSGRASTAGGGGDPTRGWGTGSLFACPCHQNSPPAASSNAAIAPPRTRSTRSEEHTSELQSLMRISYAVFCLKKKKITQQRTTHRHPQDTINTRSHDLTTRKRTTHSRHYMTK